MQVLRNSSVFYYKLKLMTTFCFNQWMIPVWPRHETSFSKGLVSILVISLSRKYLPIKTDSLQFFLSCHFSIQHNESGVWSQDIKHRYAINIFIVYSFGPWAGRGPSTSITGLWKRQVSSHEDFRHTVSIKLDTE